MVKAGEWVQIHKVVLTAEQRAPQVPEDTKAAPLEMWVKGYLTTDAQIGDWVTIETVTKRKEQGELVNVHPIFTHSFGEFVPEVIQIHQLLDKALRGEGD